MLMHILRFEVKSGLKKISFWVYCIIFFSISFLIVNILGGAIIGASAVMDNTKSVSYTHLTLPTKCSV